MTIAVDSSAIIAILAGEAEGERCAAALARETRRLLSVENYVETGTVLAGRLKSGDRLQAMRDLELFLALTGIEIAPVNETQARLALTARLTYGRGFGSAAGLNFGDCFAYALAKAEGAPLLYVGNDFGMTDVEAAM